VLQELLESQVLLVHKELLVTQDPLGHQDRLVPTGFLGQQALLAREVNPGQQGQVVLQVIQVQLETLAVREVLDFLGYKEQLVKLILYLPNEDFLSAVNSLSLTIAKAMLHRF